MLGNNRFLQLLPLGGSVKSFMKFHFSVIVEPPAIERWEQTRSRKPQSAGCAGREEVGMIGLAIWRYWRSTKVTEGDDRRGHGWIFWD